MKTRAKMRVAEVVSNTDGYWQERGGQVREVIKFWPVTDDGTPENERFHGATPCGKLELSIDNPEVHGRFRPGQQFYVDIIAA